MTENSTTQNVPENKEHKYAILMETSGEECESWYYFIRYEGNQENLKHLQKQLETIDWYILDDLCTFDLEMDYLVSEKTAKEMTKVDLNHTSAHRKFDGKLEKINLKLRTKDPNKREDSRKNSAINERNMTKIFDKLGYGQIENYIDGEDIDEEDMVSSSSSELSTSTEEEEQTSKKKKTKIPPALLNSNLPRFAKGKQHRKKRK